MSSQIPWYLSNLLSLSTINQTPHRNLSIRSASMAPRASAIKEQGLSKVVAVGIEAPQRGSTISVIADNWVTPINFSTMRI